MYIFYSLGLKLSMKMVELLVGKCDFMLHLFNVLQKGIGCKINQISCWPFCFKEPYLSVSLPAGLKKPVELSSGSFSETCPLTITQAVMIFHVQVLDSSLRTSSSGSRLYHFSKAAFILWGMLTSFAKELINSLSTLFPLKTCFHCTGKTSFYSAAVWFHLTVSVSKEALGESFTPRLEFCLISSRGKILLSSNM